MVDWSVSGSLQSCDFPIGVGMRASQLQAGQLRLLTSWRSIGLHMGKAEKVGKSGAASLT
jgi:hypothetical protein